MSEQTKLDWEFGKGKPYINPETLRRKIIESVLQQGFVIDFGNGVVAENYEEFERITRIIEELGGKIIFTHREARRKNG